jgi:hypothetical protein
MYPTPKQVGKLVATRSVEASTAPAFCLSRCEQGDISQIQGIMGRFGFIHHLLLNIRKKNAMNNAKKILRDVDPDTNSGK